MLKDEILEKIFANKEMQMIPIGCQSTSVSVFEDVLEELGKNRYSSNAIVMIAENIRQES